MPAASPFVLILFVSMKNMTGGVTTEPPIIQQVEGFKSIETCRRAAQQVVETVEKQQPWLLVGAYCMERK